MRKVQQQELQGELRQQKQRSEAELAERDEKVRALEAEAEGKSWTSTWDATVWASWGGSWGSRWGLGEIWKTRGPSEWVTPAEPRKDEGERKVVLATQASEKPLKTGTVTLEPTRV